MAALVLTAVRPTCQYRVEPAQFLQITWWNRRGKKEHFGFPARFIQLNPKVNINILNQITYNPRLYICILRAKLWRWQNNCCAVSLLLTLGYKSNPGRSYCSSNSARHFKKWQKKRLWQRTAPVARIGICARSLEMDCNTKCALQQTPISKKGS